MSNIYFPDIGNALASSGAARLSRDQRNYLAEERAAEKADAPHIAAALQGDRTAIDRVSPKTALKLAPIFDRMDAGQRTKAKEAAEFTASASNAILQADPAERPAIYQQVIADGKARGFDLSRLPPQYSPQIDAQLRTYRSMAIPMLEHFKQSGDGVTYAAPAGGGATPAGAIGGIESGGKYDAVGPVANAQGQRAYGKYQVLEPNIGPWTQEVLGKAMTPQEFLANPQAQDAVFKTKFGQYQAKYGPEGAARAWFAGEGGMNNPNAKDVLGTTVQGYGQRFAQATGSAPPGVAQGDGGPPSSPAGAGPQAPPALAPLRGLQLPPGARVALQKGVPIVKDGNVLYIDAQGGWGAAPLPKSTAPKEQGGGPFAGNSMDAQAMNILLSGDPSSPLYALAYSHMSKPRTTLDDQGRMVTIQPMDLSSVRRPMALGGGQTAPQPPEAAPPGAPPAPGATTQAIPGGGSVTVSPSIAPKGPSPAEMAKLRDAKAEGQTIINALEEFRTAYKGAGLGDRAKSMAGVTTPLNTSFNKAALLAKGEALFNLGVLNGPDLDIIRRTLPDPGTFKSGAVSSAEADASIDQVISLINDRIAQKEKQLGIAGPAPAAAPPPNAATQAIPEGATATNPQTGQKIIFRGGQWGPVQ